VKKRAVLILSTMLVVAAAVFPMSGAGVQSQSEPVLAAPPQPIPDMYNLLNYPYMAVIEELGEGPDRDAVIADLWERPETQALLTAMGDKGFVFDATDADAMTMVVETDATEIRLIGMTVTMVADEKMGALTAIGCPQMACPEGFYQAHFTNLDPLLAEVPDPPIVFNGMPYFFITTLRWVNGRIVYWRYWWFDSHHHPNWYYSHYFWYWRHWYWYYTGVDWPYWYWWAHGWYYWRYWYFWSTWFPWQQPLVPISPNS
jgi:hypothetical protein